ncbi:protein translocase subunit SecDF [Metamycoplasma alkalescens]|uniref:protein translocase subunit SecDF n=1 Tax=Metamycoplasma alkalescens TaxID=45363 RepID=UPI003D03F16C
MNKKNKVAPAIKWVFSIFILLFMILAIIFGSLFYLSPNLKKNNPVNDGHVNSRILLKIQKDNYQTSSKRELAPNKIADIVKDYLQEKDDKLTSNFDVNLVSNDQIEVKSLLATNEKKQEQLINTLVKKPYLTITDHTGTPLFYKGKFQGNLETVHGLDELIKEGSQNFNMDLDANPASDKIPEGYADRIQIKLNNHAWDQFTHLAFHYYIRSLQNQNQDFEDPQNKVYFWLNLDEFVQNAMQNDKENWDAAQKNPVNYAYVGHKPKEEIEKDKDGNVIKSLKPFLKNSINAQKYLISSASPISLISSKKRDSIFYLINNSPNGYSNKQLTSLINFSYTPFILEKEKAEFGNKNSIQFDSYILAITIIFIAMSAFLVIKHRLLGVISVVAMAFLLFVLLTIITAFGVIINSLIALTIIFILVVLFNLIAKKLQIFNKEIKEGSNTNKAINKATKKSLLTGLDILAVLGIGAIISFYLNINHSATIGAIIGISCLLIAIIIIGFNTLILRSTIQTEFFELKRYLLLKTSSKEMKWTNKINIFFKAKFFIIPLILILFAALITYSVFAIKENSAYAGFNIKNYFNFEFINQTINLADTNVNYLLSWTILLIVLINLAILIYISFRYSIQASCIYLVKQLLATSLLISFLLIFRIKIDNFIFDALLIISFINILSTIINSSRINSEFKKDINTKNFIYKEEQIKDIFQTMITDSFLIQNINLLIGITILISSPFLLVSISFNAILALGGGIIIIWYLHLFIIPKIWSSLLIKKYQKKQKRIENNYWKTEKIAEQTFIGINDFSI